MLAALPVPAAAQVDSRLERIEAELRALQRAVFPGGDERYFEPEIRPEASNNQPSQPQPGVSTSALTDVLARLDAIEAQLARLTAATEVNENALMALEMRMTAAEERAAAAEAAAAAAPPAPTGPIAVPGDEEEVELAVGDDGELPAVGPSPDRLEAVQAIAKPATDDAAYDEYVYGFRLWDAGFYPEAQQQLSLYLEQNPGHSANSRARNLLGRAFLDAGEPRRAATHFFENYQNDKQGERAADSLLYLAESMIELGDTRRACIALAEFGDTYPALAVGRLQEMYEGLGGRVDCE